MRFHLEDFRGLPLLGLPLGAPRVTAVGVQLGDAAGRATVARAEWKADSKQDSFSLFLGGRIGGGFGVY